MFAGVVLAAGASTRMGSPKALSEFEDGTAIARVAAALKKGGCEQAIIVVGAHADAIRKAAPAGAKVVVNEAWAKGRTGSIKMGVKAAPKDSHIVIWPVDHPLASAETVKKLLWGRGLIRVPTFNGKRGHPTFFDRSLRDELLRLGDDQPLHDVLHADASRVQEMATTDPGVLDNLDTPQDLQRARREEADRARPPS